MGDLDDTQNLDFEWEGEEENNNSNGPAPWARLVALERSNPDIDLYESDTVVGRAHTNGNRKVSKFHCRIHKDSSGQVSVSNLSKNGTHMNGAPLDIEQCSTFQHGDEINLGPIASGVPQYIFHVLDKGLQEEARVEKKRPNECLELDLQTENAKRLKLSKVKDDFKCCICLSVWHDVVTVAPCLHNFCNGCFSEWYKNKGTSRCSCPQCRERIVFVKRNPTLSSIIEDYLQEFPSLRRPSEEIAHLDQIAIVRNNFVNIGGSDDHDVYTSDDDEDVQIGHCPQCPRSNTLPQAGDVFVCGPGTLHLSCTACSALVPQRADLDVPQKCAGCSLVFCGMYWLSQNILHNTALVNCTMKKMSERTLSDLPRGAFRGNAYEQDVTKRYIQEQRLQIRDVILEWLGKMDNGETDKPELPCSPQPPFAELYFCNQCADTVVHHLLYKFRLSVPKSELPPDAAVREDCWYGRLCRTQLHRDAHARKFNHVCEPGSRASRN